MLNQINNDARILFLQLFTKELILSFVPETERVKVCTVPEAEEITEAPKTEISPPLIIRGFIPFKAFLMPSIASAKAEAEQKAMPAAERIIEAPKAGISPPRSIEKDAPPKIEVKKFPKIRAIPTDPKVGGLGEFFAPGQPEILVFSNLPRQNLEVLNPDLKIKRPTEKIPLRETIQKKIQWTRGQISKNRSEQSSIKNNSEVINTSSVQSPTNFKRMQPIIQKKPIIPPKPVQVSQKTKVKFTEPFESESIPQEPELSIQSIPRAYDEMDLGKLNVFLDDNEVTIIECAGPDKFVLVKKAGRINLTKIKLSQEDINQILKSFSEKTRIPVIKGIFKANFEDLTISAVVSDFVGSRFIISKTGTYSLIEEIE